MVKKLTNMLVSLVAALALAAGPAAAATLGLKSLASPGTALELDTGQLAGYFGSTAAYDTWASRNSATTWYYYDTGNYRVILPGNSTGPLPFASRFAQALGAYLGAAYAAATSVVNYDNTSYGLIYAWLMYEPSQSNTMGWFYPGQGSNSVYLNLAGRYSLADYGGVVAHETTHLLFDHMNTLYSRDPVGANWVTEALAYYVGDSVYAYGDRAGFSYNSFLLRNYSRNGSQKSDWYSSGARYNGVEGYGNGTTLDQVQMMTIGYFLANTGDGLSAIQNALTYLSQGDSIESAFSKAYGAATGQSDTSTGSGVGTLYSQYIYYYLGHY